MAFSTVCDAMGANVAGCFDKDGEVVIWTGAGAAEVSTTFGLEAGGCGVGVCVCDWTCLSTLPRTDV